ncbi:MAG: DUF2207 domain-containing protein [Rhizobiales bacterium]|nr:DUF2207 domain-containing protein [Hyphomicrobiales bacterium]
MRAFICAITPLLFCLGLLGAAHGEEKILSFDSEVTIAKDGTLQVHDTIVVQAERRLIRRGIFRDFSTSLIQPNGETVRVGYTIKNVQRNGADDTYHTEKTTGNLRLYIGHQDIFLGSGIYRYDIWYEADRQFITTDSQDILNWNVTGNFWPFDIEKTSLKLYLPDGSKVENFKFFTGREGSKAAMGIVEKSPDGKALGVDVFSILHPGEGLTIFLELEKGSINPTTVVQKQLWFWRDHLEELLIGVILVVVSLYYLFVWVRVGRDPPGGVVVPRWRISDHISPALVHYIHERGFGALPFKAMSAAILSLATRDMIAIEGGDKKMSLARHSLGGIVHERRLPAGEAAIYDALADDHEPMMLTKDNGVSVMAMVKSFRAAVEKEHRNKYFLVNRGYCVFGIILSVLGVFALLASAEGAVLELIPAFLIIAVGTMILIVMVIKLFQAMRSKRGQPWRIMLPLIPFAIFFVGGATFGVELMGKMGVDMPFLLFGLVGLFGLNVLFFYLMRAPTPIGRKIMDEIEGLSIYLNLAEKDRLNLVDVPDMSPTHFETLLPMAIALGVEKPWSNAFDTWLRTATAAQMAQMAGGTWHGHSIGNPGSLGSELSQLSRSLESGMSHAMPAPKASSSSSSGGGFSSGGFSGGGGGSSGGGGW